MPTPESTMISSPDTQEIPEFTEEEFERVIKKDKKTQRPWIGLNNMRYYKTEGEGG